MKRDRGYTHPDSIPPSNDAFLSAAEAAGKEDGLDWVSIQFMMFLEMSRQRSRHANGINPLSFTDIQAYLQLNRIELHPVEMDNLLQLDNLFISLVNEQISQELNRAKGSQ